MSAITRGWVLVCLLVVGAALPLLGATAVQDKSPRTDFLGDPLPDGALVRHGTLRLRHRGEIESIVFTPDSKGLLSLGLDQTLRKWDVATGKEEWRFERHGQPLFVAIPSYGEFELIGGGGKMMIMDRHGGRTRAVTVAHSADGKLLVAADESAGVLVMDTSTKKEVRRFQMDRNGVAVGLSGDGKLLAVCERLAPQKDNIVRLWDLASAKELPSLTISMGQQLVATKLVFSNDNKQLAGILSSRGQIRLWDLTTGKRSRLYEHHQPVCDVAFSSDGRLLVSASEDHSARVWETTSEEEIKRFKLDDHWPTAVAFAPNGQSVIVGDSEGCLHLWDLVSGKEKTLKTRAGYAGSILAVAFAPDGGTAASACRTGAIRLWDSVSGEEKKVVTAPPGLLGMAVRDGGKSLVLYTANGQLRHIDTLTGVERQSIKTPQGEFHRIELAPGGQAAVLLSGLETLQFQLWDCVEANKPRKLADHETAVSAGMFSPDGQLLFTSVREGGVRVWNVATGKEILQIPKILGFGGAFSPDGKLLAVWNQANEGALFELLTGKERVRLRTVRSDSGELTTVFSPDSRLLAIGGDDVVRLWDVVKGKAERGLIGHQGTVSALAFSPKENLLASGGVDGTVRLWKLDTGEEVRCFSGHQGSVERLAFSDDGKMLISAGADQCIVVWDATSRTSVKASDPTAKLLERCWADLASDDGSLAFEAMRDMTSLPKETIALLGKKLQPAPAVDAAVIDQLIGELDSPTFAVREKATVALQKLDGQARAALENALAKSPTPEVQSRAKKLIARLDGPVAAPEELRIARAVELLERIGNLDARELLMRLAKGAAGARLTVEASASQKRLAK